MKNNTAYKLLIILPIIDLLTSLTRRFFSVDISFGIIFKGIIALLLIFYLLFFMAGKFKEKVLPLIVIGFYLILYLFINFSGMNNIVFEVISLFRFLFYPLMFYLLFRVLDSKSIDTDKLNKSLLLSLVLYLIVFTLSQVTKSSFNSYIGDNIGGVGWYYAANEISVILVMLFPFVYYLLEKNKKLLFYFLGLVSVFFISMIGTKVSSFGILIITLLYIILPFVFKKEKIKYPFKHTFILFVISLFILFGSASMFNLKTASSRAEEEVERRIQEQIAHGGGTINLGNKQLDKAVLVLLSGRDTFLISTIDNFKINNSLKDIFFGMGLSTTNDNFKWIEMDFFDIFFFYGIVGLVIILSPLIFTIYLIIKKKILFKKLTFASTIYILIIGLVLAISFISGHVIGAPAVSIYLIIYQLLLLRSIDGLRTKEINQNKVSILSLHLGHGGIEQANVNLANMLVSKYDVELISLYKVIDKIPYKLNEKVKLTYLSNLKPNREEFKMALNNKKYLSVFKEGLRAVYILILKRYLVAKNIVNNDSKYIISSRIEFTNLLSLLGSKQSIKIAQEHRHHNNEKKYFKALRKALINIDYLIPVSQELSNYYQQEYKDLSNLEVLYIRHALDYYPDKINNYNGKNIISVGRLSEEKGFDDLIKVFNEVLKIDKNFKLTICGAGDQEQYIQDLIKKYKLTKAIKMTGFLNKDKLHQEYASSSIFVLASKSEAFGLVFIEAMSFGLPCITFDSAQGAKEIINGNNGIMIENRDIKLMAKEIVKLTKDKAVYEQMSNQARKTALNYKIDKVEEYWINFIERA